MANVIVGSVQSIGAVQNLTSKSGNAFCKRDLVVSVRRFDPNTGDPIVDYENTPQFTFIGDRCRDLDNFKVGDFVSISFDLNGRKYTNAQGQSSIITEARPYKIEAYVQRQQNASMSAAAPVPQRQQYQQPQPMQQPLPAGFPQAAPQRPMAVSQQQSYQDPF